MQMTPFRYLYNSFIWNDLIMLRHQFAILDLKEREREDVMFHITMDSGAEGQMMEG